MQSLGTWLQLYPLQVFILAMIGSILSISLYMGLRGIRQDIRDWNRKRQVRKHVMNIAERYPSEVPYTGTMRVRERV